MIIPLWPDVPLGTSGNNENCPSVTPYLLDGEGPYPAVVVCPGGGYGMRASHEGADIAVWLNAIGISALVLNYRVAPYSYPAQLNDAMRAIRLARSRAAEWNLDAERIGILGFSAGGHLAATAGTLFDEGDKDADDPVERESSRPDLMVLCYPVITMGPFTHQGSKDALLGDRQYDPELVRLLSAENGVSAATPPAFLWHTVDDNGVPVENSTMFAEALRTHGIPYELHLFDSGPHGLGLAAGHEEAGIWPGLCEAWFRRMGFLRGG